MTFEEAARAVCCVDVADRVGESGPVASVFLKRGIAGLEENLHAVERADYRFRL